MSRIALHGTDGSTRGYASVDCEDFEFLAQWRWHLHSKGYAIRSTNAQGKFFMHREVMSRALGELLGPRVVHHGPGGKLDNRRVNLTVYLSDAEHKRQQHAGHGVGVCFHKQTGRWMAYLDPRPRRYLGLHDTREAALKAVGEAKRGIAITS